MYIYKWTVPRENQHCGLWVQHRRMFQESLLYNSIPLRRNVSVRISLRGLRRLIWSIHYAESIMLVCSWNGALWNCDTVSFFLFHILYHPGFWLSPLGHISNQETCKSLWNMFIPFNLHTNLQCTNAVKEIPYSNTYLDIVYIYFLTNHIILHQSANQPTELFEKKNCDKRRNEQVQFFSQCFQLLSVIILSFI